MVALSVLCHHQHLPRLPTEWSTFTSSSFTTPSCSYSFHSSNHLVSSLSLLHHPDVQRLSWTHGQSLYCDHSNRTNGRGRTLPRSTFPTSPAMISSVQDLFDFICSGPLLSKLGLTSEIVTETIDRWLEYGSQLCRLFGMNELDLSISEKIRIYHYYIPVFVWCQKEILHHKSKFKDGDNVPPLVFAISKGCSPYWCLLLRDGHSQVGMRTCCAHLFVDLCYVPLLEAFPEKCWKVQNAITSVTRTLYD